MSALAYGRRRGYQCPSPGDVCVLRCMGQELRVRVTSEVHGQRAGMVRVRFASVDDENPRPSGWPRFGGGAWLVRAGRLTFVDA